MTGSQARPASRSAGDRRTELANAAIKTLTRIADAVKDAVLEAAPAVNLRTWNTGNWMLMLNDAELEFVVPTKLSLTCRVCRCDPG
jgi:hypothetical protein